VDRSGSRGDSASRAPGWAYQSSTHAANALSAAGSRRLWAAPDDRSWARRHVDSVVSSLVSSSEVGCQRAIQLSVIGHTRTFAAPPVPHSPRGRRRRSGVAATASFDLAAATNLEICSAFGTSRVGPVFDDGRHDNQYSEDTAANHADLFQCLPGDFVLVAAVGTSVASGFWHLGCWFKTVAKPSGSGPHLIVRRSRGIAPAGRAWLPEQRTPDRKCSLRRCPPQPRSLRRSAADCRRPDTPCRPKRCSLAANAFRIDK